MEKVYKWYVMSDLIVQKKNESYLYVECDPGIGRELADFFTFFVPGYKFMPAYKNKIWDGKIRLYDQRTKTLPAGLLNYLPEFADVRDYSIRYENSDHYGMPDTKEEPVLDYLDEMTLTVKGERITPHDFQVDAIKHALCETRSILLSPTASGKSLIIYGLVRWYLKHNDGAILIVVPTTSLVEQMYSDFGDYSQFDEGFDVGDMCHKIYAGKDRYDESKRVVITTWQSIYKLSKPWFQRFGMVIGDEAHNFKAKSLTTILSNCTEARYRFGLTGTLDGTQTHQLVLEGLFGRVHNVTTTKELMAQDHVAQLDIKILVLKYNDKYCQEVTKMKYQEEIDFIVSHEPRNKFLRNLALDQDGNTLVLFNYVEKHGKPLYNLIREKVEENPRSQRKVFFVSGEVDVDARERIRSITEKEKDAIIVASLGTFSTGINIRNLHNIIFASPSKSQVKVLQSIGRGLRKSDDGRTTQLYDIADDLHWKKSKNYTLDHAAIRIQMYTKEHFNFKIYEVQLP